MRKNVKILAIALIFVTIVGAVLFFPKEEKPKDETTVIRILDSSTPNEWEIAQKLTGRDILEEEGVKLELINSVQSNVGTQGIQALLANNIDYTGSAWPAWINAIASGGKIKAVVSGTTNNKNDPGSRWVVLENSSIYSAKDFIGKRIAVNGLGAERDYVTREYLKRNGIPIEQVQIVPVPNPQIEQVLRTGQVDIAALLPPYFDVAYEGGGLRIIFTNYDIKGDNTLLGSGFRDDFIEKHPDTVKRFVIAFEKSKRIVWEEFQKNPENVKKALAQIYEEKGGNPKEAKYYKPLFSPENPYTTDKDIQWWIDIFESEGKLKPGQIKPSDVYTNEFIPDYKENIGKRS